MAKTKEKEKIKHSDRAEVTAAKSSGKPATPPQKSMREILWAYVKSAKAGLYVTSFEEVRVESEIKSICDELKFKMFYWSLTEGIVCASDKPPTQIPETEDPIAMLDTFMKLPEKSILVARDFHMLLGGPQESPNPMIVRKIKDAIRLGYVSNRVFIIVGCRLRCVPELEKEMAVVEFKLPDKAQLSVVIRGIAKSAGTDMDGDEPLILDAASGLTTQEAADAAAMSVVEAGKILPAIVAREKSSTVKKNGILEIFETTLGLSDIRGLGHLMPWLCKRKAAFSDAAKTFGLPTPKGILVTGIPGTGKSLSAKVSSNIFGVPLLRLDAGRIFASLVGQSEENLRAVIQTAEAIAPCILWCDEIEKAFSGSKSSGQTDGGTSARVFGTFLQWMNDKTSPVFVFATANDITQLPPEFLRKGRFDELWFVDLPDINERAEIWDVHLRKRDRNPDEFDIKTLSERTEGFTGAEIEAAVTEGLYSVFDESSGKSDLEDRHLLDAIKNTVPLSRTMAPQIEALRAWANGRARKASAPAAAATTMQRLIRKMV